MTIGYCKVLGMYVRSLIGFYHVQLLGNRRVGWPANFSESNLTELVDLVSRTHHFSLES